MWRFKWNRLIKVIMVISALLGIVALGLRVNHRTRLTEEKQWIMAYGIGDLVFVDGKAMNVYTQGEGKSIVYMHGLGMGDTTVSTRPMLQQLRKSLMNEMHTSYRICVIDRFGNGMSQDTKEAQSIETIVETYRKALLNSGQQAPYTLIAHSISGMYATYWAQRYPKEIEAVIYLDSEPAKRYVEEGAPRLSQCIMGKVQYGLAYIGLQRVLMKEEDLIGKDENHTFTKEENKLRKYLVYQNTYSKAVESEMELYYENAKKVMENKKELTIPQLYIQADNIQGKYYEEVYRKNLEKRFKGNEEEIQSYKVKREEQLKAKACDMMQSGKVEIVKISGPHCLYEYAPTEVAEAISRFMKAHK